MSSTVKTTVAIGLLEDALNQKAEGGATSISIADIRYLTAQVREWQAEDDERGADEPTEAQLELHRAELTSWVQQQKHAHEWDMELFRSAIQAGQNALRTCLLVNGGAAVALLAFLGHLAGSDEISSVPIAGTAQAMAPYVCGVLVGALAAGFTYLAQLNFTHHWMKSGTVFQVLAVLFGLSSFGLFGYGSWLAYDLFSSLP